MRMRKFWAGMMMMVVALGLWAVATAQADHGHEVRFRIQLTGDAIGGMTPTGRAEFRARDDGRRELRVEVEDVNLPGAVLNVFIDDVFVGQIAINDELKGELRLETEHGDFVPDVQAGSTIVIADENGTTILSGTF